MSTRVGVRATPPDWTDLGRRAVDVARALATDAVERAGHAHPEKAMSPAPTGRSSPKMMTESRQG